MGSTWTPPGWYWGRNPEFTWREQYAWWPKRSYESGELIWFKKYWYGWRWIDGPAGEDPVKLEKWLTSEEYMWLQLTDA